MKILGKRILCSDLRFTFETPCDRVSTMAERAIADLDALVCKSPADGSTSLSDVVKLLNRVTYGDPDIRIGVEEVAEDREIEDDLS